MLSAEATKSSSSIAYSAGGEQLHSQGHGQQRRFPPGARHGVSGRRIPARRFFGSRYAGFAPPSGRADLAEIGVKGRALEALHYICQGYSNAVIAHKMGVAESTVANEYNSKLFKQFHVANRAGLIVEVARRGLIPSPTDRSTLEALPTNRGDEFHGRRWFLQDEITVQEFRDHRSGLTS